MWYQRMTRFLAQQLSTSHWFDISAARRDLGYEPAISTDELVPGNIARDFVSSGT